MTAWWSSTTRVRKVRARSSAALRAFAVGAARTCADATELEMDVMAVPADDDSGCCRREPDSARPAGCPGIVCTGAWSGGLPGDDPELPARFRKSKLKQ